MRTIVGCPPRNAFVLIACDWRYDFAMYTFLVASRPGHLELRRLQKVEDDQYQPFDTRYVICTERTDTSHTIRELNF
jgi:hypothetical protein